MRLGEIVFLKKENDQDGDQLDGDEIAEQSGMVDAKS